MVDFKDFPSEAKPFETPEGSAPPVNVMSVEATVENKPQELRMIRPFAEAVRDIPTDIRAEAQITMQALFDCFTGKKTVQEGLVSDLVWGFSQCGIPPECTVVGLQELMRLGYVRFQANDNTCVDFNTDTIFSAWIKYEKKLLDIVYT